MANYNEIRSLSEKELADALYRVAVSMGQSEKKARETALRAREIKAILSRASDRELEKIVKSIGKTNTENIIKDVKQKEGEDL